MRHSGIVVPALLVVGFALLVLFSDKVFGAATLEWTAPEYRTDGSPIEPGLLEYRVHWSSNDQTFRPVEEDGSIVAVPTTEYGLPTTLGGLECVYVAVSAVERTSGLESELSNSVQYCLSDLEPGNGDGPDVPPPNNGGSGSGPEYAPTSVSDLRISVDND